MTNSIAGPVETVEAIAGTFTGWAASAVSLVAVIVAAVFVLWAIPKFVSYVKRAMR